MAKHYLSPDRNGNAQPSLRVNVLCGDGRMFTAFRQAIIMKNYLVPPIPIFTSNPKLGHNIMKHGNLLVFETVGSDRIKLFETHLLTAARGIHDRFKKATDVSLSLPNRSYREWLQNPEGPCRLSYFVHHKNELALIMVDRMGTYAPQLDRIILEEWNPYIAGKRKIRFTALVSRSRAILSSGLFIHACRLHLTNIRDPVGCTVRNASVAACNEHGAVAEAAVGAAAQEELANDGF